MRLPNTSSLPNRYRSRADLVAFIIGALGLPLSAFLVSASYRGLPHSIAVLLLIVGLATAAGAASIWKINGNKAEGFHVIHLVRAGARAGVLAALLGAAMTVLAARIFVSQPAAVVAFVPAVLSILPGAFFGMLTAAVVAGVRAPALPKPAPLESESRQPPRLIRLILTIACGIGFFSALIPQHYNQSISRPSGTTALPGWRYEMPPDLATAPAARWQVSAIRSLGRIAANSPLAIAPAGDLLAFFDGDSQNVLKIIDLNTPARVSTFAINDLVQRIAFSHDGRRLIFKTDRSPRRLGVIDLDSSRVLWLPKPKAGVIPDGDFAWLSETEVVFQAYNPPLPILDLDSLELTDSKTSRTWTALSGTDRIRFSFSLRIELPSTARCGFEFRPAIATAEVPSDLQKEDWPMTGGTFVSLKDVAHDYRQFFEINAIPGDRFLGTADASKLVRVRQSEAVVMYFTLRTAPGLTFKIAMPKSPEQHGSAATSALAANELCVLAYAPLVNPLNQKVVGPDREHVKGILRFSSWNGNEASLWLTEEFSPITSDDIIADLHVWKNNRAELIVDSEPHRWWSKVGPAADGQSDVSKLPTREAAKPLEHTSNYTLATESGSLVVKNIEFQPIVHEPPVSQSAPIPTPFSPAELPASPNAFVLTPKEAQGYPRTISPADPAHQVVSSFVAAHHDAANRGDINALVNDYADQVIYLRNGRVDRNFIYRDETKSRASFVSIYEELIYPIVIQQIGPEDYKAQYKIAYQGLKRNNQSVKGTSDMFLFLKFTPRGLRILNQQNTLD